MSFKVGIIGIGFVGGAIYKSFLKKNINVVAYDKYKDLNTFEDCLQTDMLFLALPTLFNDERNEYDLDIIMEVCKNLNKSNYKNLIIIKSTVAPLTIQLLSKTYPQLQFCHNPEFLKAATAFEDFYNQTHIVLGKHKSCEESSLNMLINFYTLYWPNANLSICNSEESESMKLIANSFYASKIQLFNEYYLLCNKLNINFEAVKILMLKNNRIHESDTMVPGPDGELGYGGACFPKDTKALLSTMQKAGTSNIVLDAVIKERDTLRED